MIVAGIDVGSASVKAVLLTDGQVAAWRVIPASPDGPRTAAAALDLALGDRGLALPDVQYVVATGYGRVDVPFAQANVTEISCHARGAHWLNPDTRTILDVGGQDCKAIRCDGQGKVETFAMNDKCAAGTGRYLERIAALLRLPLDEIGPRSLAPVGPLEPINSYCVVFAENDILLKLRQGKHPHNMLAGACDALVARNLSLLRRVGVVEQLVISGGVGKNAGIVARLEAALGVPVDRPAEPQIVGALGAALFARERAER